MEFGAVCRSEREGRPPEGETGRTCGAGLLFVGSIPSTSKTKMFSVYFPVQPVR